MIVYVSKLITRINHLLRLSYLNWDFNLNFELLFESLILENAAVSSFNEELMIQVISLLLCFPELRVCPQLPLLIDDPMASTSLNWNLQTSFGLKTID